MNKCYGSLGYVVVGTGHACDVDIYDMHRYLHPDIMVTSCPVYFPKIDEECLTQMKDMIDMTFGVYPKIREQLGPDRDQLLNIQIAHLSCTSASLMGPPGYDAMLGEMVKKASGAKIGCTTTTAVLSAFKALETKRLSVVTPYPDEVANQEKNYFQKAGYEVCGINNIPSKNINNPFYIMHISPREIYDFAVEHFDSRADTLFLSCTGLNAIDLIERLEQKLGVAVVTSNQASIWLISKHIGAYSEASKSLGKLFRV